MGNFYLSVAAIVLLTACPPSPVAPSADASDGSTPSFVDAAPTLRDALPSLDAPSTPEDIACAAMAKVGCTVLPDCATTIRKINSDPKHFVSVNVACLERVHTQADVAVCKTSCK